MTERINVFRDMIYSDSPLTAAREEAGEKLPPSFPASLYPSCVGCKIFLIPGALYKDGFRDGDMWCHACLRNAHLAGYYAAEETIIGREDTEERYDH